VDRYDGRHDDSSRPTNGGDLPQHGPRQFSKSRCVGVFVGLPARVVHLCDRGGRVAMVAAYTKERYMVTCLPPVPV